MNNCFKITDSRFSEDRIDLYDLTIEVQFSRLRFTVQSGESIIWLEDHFLGFRNDISKTKSKIHEILISNTILQYKEWKRITLISDFQIHTLLPKENFAEAKEADYLITTYPAIKSTDFDFIVETSNNQSLVTGTLKQINTIFSKYYAPKPVELSSTTVAGFRYLSQNSNTKNLCVVSDTFWDIYEKNLKTQNITISKIPQSSLSSFKKASNSSALELVGEITPFGEKFRKLEENFENITIHNFEPGKKIGDSFSEVAAYRYFTLLS